MGGQGYLIVYIYGVLLSGRNLTVIPPLSGDQY